MTKQGSRLHSINPEDPIHTEDFFYTIKDTTTNLTATGKVTVVWKMPQKLPIDPPDLTWTIPEEGAVRWAQSIGVLADSEKPELALEFIKYIMSPEGQARLATSSCYWAMPANAKAGAELTDQQKTALRWDDQKDYLSRSQLYPAPSADLDAKMQDVWTEFLQQ